MVKTGVTENLRYALVGSQARVGLRYEPDALSRNETNGNKGFDGCMGITSFEVLELTTCGFQAYGLLP